MLITNIHQVQKEITNVHAVAGVVGEIHVGAILRAVHEPGRGSVENVVDKKIVRSYICYQCANDLCG